MKIVRIFLFVTLLASIVLSEQASAQVPAIGAALAGKTVSDIINQIKQVGVTLLAQADSSGNAMISHGANEANVLAQNLSFQFRDRLNESFDRLNDQEKMLLIESESIRQSLAQLSDKAYDAKDSFVVDLNQIVDRFPFVSKGFFLQSVRGVAFLPGAGNFQIRTFASTLGIQDGVTTKLRLTVDGKEIESANVDQSQQRGLAIITIPNSALANKFKDNDLVLVPASLTFDVERKAGWWIFSHTENESYQVPLTFSLYPRLAAKVTAKARAPKFAWVNIGIKSITKDTPDRHCSKNCGGEPTRGPNSVEMVVAGGDAPTVGYQRFVEPLSLKCITGNGVCDFAGAIHTSITDQGTRAKATWDTWSRPSTWELAGNVQEYKLTGDEPWSSAPTLAKFGSVVKFDFPKNSTVETLEVVTFTKQQYEVLVATHDPSELLKYQGAEPAAPPDVDRRVYQVDFPHISL
jgi:hypothetical protein